MLIHVDKLKDIRCVHFDMYEGSKVSLLFFHISLVPEIQYLRRENISYRNI